MLATIYPRGTCPVCAYRNEGIQVGTARPRMNGLVMQPRSIGWVPQACRECGHPMDPALYTQAALDQDTAVALKAWQERQRARRTKRRAA